MPRSNSQPESSVVLPPTPRAPRKQERPASPPAARPAKPAAAAEKAKATESAAEPRGRRAAPVASALVEETTQAVADEQPSSEAAQGGLLAGLKGLWARRRFWQGSSAVVGSMILHFVVLVFLGLWALPRIAQEMLPPLTASTSETEETAEIEVAVQSQMQQKAEAAAQAVATAMASAGGGGAPAMTQQPSLDPAVASQVTGTSVSFSDPLTGLPGKQQLAGAVPTGARGVARAVVKDYGAALDRLVQEILMRLSTGDVLLIWVFDQSESMKDDQKEIRDRLDRVYAELGQRQEATGDALMTSVVSFGEGYAKHLKVPTNSLDEIKRAIDDVPVDPSGKEMTFQAIGMAVSQHRGYASKTGRQMMLVIVTDESGDRDNNDTYLEPAIEAAKSVKCPVYILGREAVFGYPYAHIAWRHPQTGHTHWLPIDRGPETAFVEQLQTDGFRRRHDSFSSGFGPYEQARIARETNGIFFMLPSVEAKVVQSEKRLYQLEQMRFYQPDLRARHEVIEDRETSELQRTLFKIVYDLNPYNPEVQKIIELRHHFAGRPDEFFKQAQAELQKAKTYLTYLVAATQAWESIQHLRAKETSRRWQANCDLLYAQLLAYQVRVIEYGARLETFLKNPDAVPFEKPGGYRLTAWHLGSYNETLTGEQTAETIAKSRAMFEQVIAQHPGTPWAARAEWELRRGFGVTFKPVYHKPPKNPKPTKRKPVTIPVPKL